MNVRRFANSIIVSCILFAAAAAQDDGGTTKDDLIEKLQSGSIKFDEADEAWAQLKVAIRANPDNNWYSSQLSLARVFAYKQQFDLAIEVLKQGFDYHIQKLADPKHPNGLAAAHLFASEIAIYSGRSSTPKVGSEVLDTLIPRLRKKVASIGSPDGHSEFLASAIALRSQSLPAQEARKLIDAELARTQSDAQSNPENQFATFALIEAMKSTAVPPYQGGQTDLDLVNNLLRLAKALKDRQGGHKIGWGIEFCDVNCFVIEGILNEYPNEAQRIMNDALKQIEEAGKDDDLFSQQMRFYVAKLERLGSRIEDAKRYLAIVGNPAPPFEAAAWLNGEPAELQKLRGHVVLLDFTAVWCGPCIQQLPELKALHKQFQERGLVIISVTDQYDYTWDDETNSPVKAESEVGLPDQVEMLEKFVHRHEIPFRLMVTEKDSTFAKSLGVNGIPHAVIIDGDGVVRMIRGGNTPGNATDLRRQVESLVENQHAAPGG